MSDLTEAEVLAIEAMLAERLFNEARMMTSIGLEIEDTRDPRTAQFVDILMTKTATNEEAKAFSQQHWPHFKATGILKKTGSFD